MIIFSVKQNHLNKLGFTLIELLVVIAIIGTLASVVLASLNSAREKAREAAAYAEMNQLIKVMVAAQIESGQSLAEVTEQGLIPNHGTEYCSGCPCGVSTASGGFIGPNAARPNRPSAEADLRNIPESDTCYVWWDRALDLIESKAGGLAEDAALRWDRDPWGSPYILDENEGEVSLPPCSNDVIYSAGPNGVFEGWIQGGNPRGDDLLLILPLGSPGCS